VSSHLPKGVKIDPRQINWQTDGYDLEVAHTLSAAGWSYDVDTATWRKGQHSIATEGLGNILNNFRAVRSRILKAILAGALAFEMDVQADAEGTGWEFQISVTITWPDAVTRLGAITT